MPDPGVERHNREQDQISDAERFALAAIQTVSAALSFGILNQLATLFRVAGQPLTLTALTFVVVALALSILAAYLRHQYRQWEAEPRITNPGHTFALQKKMRRLMLISAILLPAALCILLLGMWWTYFVRGITL